jgi:endonuclease III
VEFHKGSFNIEDDISKDIINKGPTEYFNAAYQFVLEHYSAELNRIASVNFKDVSPQFFFNECIWVICASGFSAKAVSQFFQRLITCIGTYDQVIIKDFDIVWNEVYKIFNNKSKILAIYKIAKIIDGGAKRFGWDNFRDQYLNDVKKLEKLPYIGKITCHHLGRNIGLLDCVKPDLHLQRLSNHWGFLNCESMCKHIQSIAGNQFRLGIIDLILWYFASSHGTTIIRRS